LEKQLVVVEGSASSDELMTAIKKQVTKLLKTLRPFLVADQFSRDSGAN